MLRLQERLAHFSGAGAFRLIDSGGTFVDTHSHDFPVLSLFIAGGYRNECVLGETRVNSPSAMFYQAGEAHSNVAEPLGLEQIDLEFDPDWLGREHMRGIGPARCWVGGPIAVEARHLAQLFASAAPEAELKSATQRFFRKARGCAQPRRPHWLEIARSALDPLHPLPTAELARQIDLHPSWLAQAYRRATGEGLAETVTRRRVELASHLIRTSGAKLADVAAHAGFSDQSHMVRCFRRILGRTPSQVRRQASCGPFAASLSRRLSAEDA